jgi:hypothetical protein
MMALIAVIAVGLAIDHPVLEQAPHPFIPWGLIIVLAISIPVMIFSNSNTRGARLREKARELQCSFTGRNQRFQKTLRRDFSILRGSSTGKELVRNIISGDWQGRHLTYFDYTHKSSGEEFTDTTTHYVHSGLLLSTQVECPLFSVRCKDSLRKGIEAFPLVQKFIGAPESEFDRQYTIKGKKGDRIRDRLPVEFLSFFETHPQRCLEVQENRFLYYVKDAFIDLEELETFLQEGVQIATLLERQFQ